MRKNSVMKNIFSSAGRVEVGVCRYSPTCSAYMYEAVERYGIVKGVYMGIRRILRCNPWSKGGIDPIPLK